MVIHLVAAAQAALKSLERKCPNCHHKQLVAPSKKHQVAKCEKCQSEIPVRKDGPRFS